MMERYKKYKDSGVEWIGEIPEHWLNSTIGRIGQLGRGRVISGIEMNINSGEYPVYSSQTKNYGVMGYLDSYDFEGEYVTWTTDGANAGTVSWREGKFNCTNVCGTIQPKNWAEIDLRYLPYFLNLGTKFSVRFDINPKLMNGMMAKIPIAIPPKPEQTAIANYLDRKTAEIDQLITQKERLIELYEEEKTTIINQAITQGINPDVKLKDSGIDWLGEIPKHWDIKRLRYLGSCQNGVSKGGEYFGSGFPFISYGDVYNHFILPQQVKGLAESTEDDRVSYSVIKGDILFTRTSETADEIGLTSTCLKTVENAIFSGFLIRFRPTKNNLFEGFTKYYFSSTLHRLFFVKEMNLVTRASLSQDLLKKLPVVLPSIDEQKQIALYLDRGMEHINKKITKTKKIIALQKEYRTALISEVVTGKIKVTQEVAS